VAVRPPPPPPPAPPPANAPPADPAAWLKGTNFQGAAAKAK
jgi:hypothetical protein